MQCTFNKWRYFLNEVDASYLQKLFHVIVSASISKERGGDITETQAEIRGIDGVTTLSVVEGSEREDAYNYYRRFSIKFELIKGNTLDNYLGGIFIPGLRRIKGLHKIKFATKVKEI